MSHTIALPFLVQRRTGVVARPAIDGSTRGSVTSTRETVEGLLILDGDRLVVQWRVAREVQHIGEEIRSDSEVEPVQEVVLPLTGFATPRLRRKWRRWRRRWEVVITAADLRTLEPLRERGGIQLAHAAEMIISIEAADRDAAAMFVKEMDYALAEEAFRDAEAIGGESPAKVDSNGAPRSRRLSRPSRSND